MAPTESREYSKSISESLNKRVTAYSVAAAAAGVSVLAMGQSAAAKVIITNKTIPIQGVMTLDLNNDGIPDMEFSFDKTYGHSVGLAFLNVLPTAKGDQFVAKGSYASALLRSAKIGPSQHFTGTYNQNSIRGALIEQNGCTYSKCVQVGNWGGNHPNRFLGVKFLINGKIHYGWVRITVSITTQDILQATITEYGYETIAGKRVLAGVPSNNAEVSPKQAKAAGGDASLGMLALGSDGIQLWRREGNVVHQ